jgi:hypothetical protein
MKKLSRGRQAPGTAGIALQVLLLGGLWTFVTSCSADAHGEVSATELVEIRAVAAEAAAERQLQGAPDFTICIAEGSMRDRREAAILRITGRLLKVSEASDANEPRCQRLVAAYGAGDLALARRLHEGAVLIIVARPRRADGAFEVQVNVSFEHGDGFGERCLVHRIGDQWEVGSCEEVWIH